MKLPCLRAVKGVQIRECKEEYGAEYQELVFKGNNADICLQPQDEGPCRALLRRYYYDRSTQSCRLFYYGGCEGNANNFETLEDCNEACWRIESKWPCSSSDLLAASNLIFQIPFSTVRFSLYFLNH
uniref:BPTI/Kunitz inhibitor domain-containing protein n=1 Tax=Neovison vison TaxID=452646 RepID=A0A8C7BFG4_NEOVI